MKILFCLGSMTKGGAERVIANLSNEFVKRYDVSIVVTPPDKPMYEINKHVIYHTLDFSNDSEGIIKRTIRRIIRLRKILKEEKPDIILSLLPEPTFRVILAKTFLKIKTIISVRNDPNIEYNNFIKKMLVKILYTRADGFIFQTPDAQAWFSKKIQKKSVIIPNPINELFIEKPFDGQRENTIINVGRLVEQKNQDLLIDTFYEFQKVHSEYILKIYGEGKLKNKLEHKVKELNLIDKVLFMGEVNDLKEQIYKSGIFVLSSDYEGMPNALMEAMALGIPCISSDCPCGGPRFLIKNNKNGILFKVKNKDELLSALNRLVENVNFAKKIGDEANKICEQLNPTIIYRKFEEYILSTFKGE